MKSLHKSVMATLQSGVCVMKLFDVAAVTRRNLLTTGLIVAGAAACPASAQRVVRGVPPIKSPGSDAPDSSPRVVRPELFRQALAALQRHGSSIASRDRIAIADFAQPSSRPRFHVVDLASGATSTFLVAHGSGSDPDHSGWLQRFSNAPNSNASCEGAFLASDYYVGKHGKSQRLVGLDSTNDNALARAIVVHSAWYANEDMIAKHGMLGRSQGCFAVGEAHLAEVFARLGPGRMIFAAKV